MDLRKALTRSCLFWCLFLCHSLPAQIIPVSDSLLSDFLSKLFLDDDERPNRTQVLVNFQNQFNRTNWTDQAEERLFSSVDPLLLSRPLYRKFLALFDNYFATTGMKEDVTVDEAAEIDTFLDDLLKTRVFNRTFGFLLAQGHPASRSRAHFRAQFKSLWFDQYSRQKGVLDSSAFEHVIVGEIIRRRRKRSLSGLHSWLRFYTLEKADGVNYVGYVARNPNLATIAYQSGDLWQPIGGFMLDTSPAFDMAAYTLCFWLRGNKPCKFHLNTCAINIQSYVLKRNGTSLIGTIFPSPGKMSGACRKSMASFDEKLVG